MRAFQLTVLGLLLGAAALGGWYFYRAASPLQIVLITDEQGEYRSLSQGLQASLRQALQGWARDYQIRVLPYASDLKALAKHFPDPSRMDLVIGCVDSPCARQVLALLNTSPVPFFYPSHSEGLVQQARFWHLGAVTNQLLFPALAKALHSPRETIYFVGQESVQSRMQAAQLQEYSSLLGASWMAEVFIRAESDWQYLHTDLSMRHPAILVNAMCGLDGIELYKRIKRQNTGIIINTCLNEHEARILGGSASGDWFLSVYQLDKEGLSQQEKLMYLAVELLGPLQQQNLKNINLNNLLRNQSRLQGGDLSVVDNNNQHVWHGFYIYSPDANGQLQAVYSAPRPERPELVPSQRTPSQWELDTLIYWRNRGGRWRE